MRIVFLALAALFWATTSSCAEEWPAAQQTIS